MKSLIAIVATLFAVSSFAADAKKEEKKSEPVKAEKKAEAKKDDKKASDAKK